MPKYKGARCFVVSLMRGGFKHYLKRIETRQEEGAPLPYFVGFFSVDLTEAQKFLKEYEAQFFAERFEGAGVEEIKTGEVLK